MERSIPASEEAAARGASWSPDDRYLSWGKAAGELFVLDVSTENRKPIELKGTSGSIWATAWSPDGEMIASSGIEKKIRIWDWKTKLCTRQLDGIHGFTSKLDWNPRGRWLAASTPAGPDNKLVWDLDSDSDQMVGPSIKNASTIRWSPDGKQLAIGTKSGKCLVYSTDTWERTSEWQAHRASVLSLDWRGDAQQLVSAGEDRLIYLWNPVTAEKILTLRGSLKQVNSVSWNPDGDLLASGDAMTRIWKLQRPTGIRQFSSPDFKTESFAWSQDGNAIIGLGVDKVVSWRVLDGELLSQIPIPPGEIQWLSPDGSRFVMTVEADQQKTINLYDAKDGTLLRPIISQANVVNRLLSSSQYSFSQDGASLAISEYHADSFDSIYIILANLNGEPNHIRFHSDIRLVGAISCSPDGKRIAGGGAGDRMNRNVNFGYVHVFDVARQERVMLSKQVPTRCCALAWSPIGTEFVSGDFDGVAAVWDSINQRKVTSTNIHSSKINCFAWTPDGKRIVSASSDNTICVWEPKSGEELIRLYLPLSTQPIQISWSPNGRQLAALTSDGIIHVWEALGYDFCQTDEFANLNIRSQLNTAVQLWQKGDKEAAKILFEKALQHDTLRSQRLPNWVTAEWIAIVENNDDYELLEFTAQQLTDEPRLHPSLVRKYLQEIRKYLQEDRPDKVMALFRSSQEKMGNRQITYRQTGELLYTSGCYSEAFAILREGVRYDAENHKLLNNLAWYLATCPDPTFINGNEAVDVARKALHLDPLSKITPNTLGVALYRNGEWQEAIDSLNKSTELRSGGDSFDWFFLAMAHWQLDQKTEALEWYEKAVQWMNDNPENEELVRFKNEATQLLGIVSKAEIGASASPKERSQ